MRILHVPISADYAVDRTSAISAPDGECVHRLVALDGSRDRGLFSVWFEAREARVDDVVGLGRFVTVVPTGAHVADHGTYIDTYVDGPSGTVWHLIDLGPTPRWVATTDGRWEADQ